jgi:tetraacyldisaccharide 4'-kinase
MERLAAWHRRLVLMGPRDCRERFLFSLLKPLGRLYGAIGSLRVSMYRRGVFSTYRAGVPVVSVGNLAVGGTGKTPMVDHLVKYLRARGRKVAVVSRGYRGRVRDVGVVSAGSGPLLEPEICGDEPVLLARRNPGAVVLVAPRRAEGVRQAVERFGADLVVLDDGFQHLAVNRDLDIVLLDARRPLGNGLVLPAGVLREFPSALRRGDLLVLTRSRGDEMFEPSPAPVLRCRHALSDETVSLDGEILPLAELSGKRGVAFAGIADPEGFFTALEESGLSLQGTVALPDHVAYDADILRRLEELCRDADFLVTTEKDGVKLRADDFSLPCYQVPLKLEFFDSEALERALEPYLN